MVVLAIAALIASITLPNLRLPGFASDAAKAARQIASGLADARQAAIFTNRESRLILDLENKTFSVDKGPAVKLNGIEKLTLLTAERDVLADSRGTIRFYPDGSAGGGEISVEDGTGAIATLRVNWLTGRISLDG
jgi:general secretion pathway protein H